MASSATSTAADFGRKLVNRVKTVAGDDAREIRDRAKTYVQGFRSEYRFLTGSRGSKKARKRDPAVRKR